MLRKFLKTLSLLLSVLNFVSTLNLQPRVGSNNVACGVSKQSFGLIVGGNVINAGDFPWLVALMKRDVSKIPMFFCGAVLIAKTKILTAAHCIQNKNNREALSLRDVLVLLGAHDLKNMYQPGMITVAVSNIIVHPQWNPYVKRFDADIAMILIEDDYDFSNSIIPICMLESEQGLAAREGVIIGYGQSEDKTKNHETIPRKLDVPIKNNEACFLENYEFAAISSNRTFCAGSKNGMGACRGDSGSGLFIKIGSTYYLKGIVSSSLFDENGDCDVKNYAVYTNVPLFRKWIDNPLDSMSLLEDDQKLWKTPNESNLRNQNSCGIMSDATGLIQGGSKTSQSMFPWTVPIFIMENADVYQQKAVGTLITNQHVIALGSPISYSDNTGTIYPFDGDRFKMYFGITNFLQSNVPGVLIIDGAAKIFLHPKIKIEVPRSSDIAVILLQSPIYFTKFISPVCLWTSENSDHETGDKIGYAVGWGLNELGQYSKEKKHVALRVQEDSTCRTTYAEFTRYGIYFCAINHRGTSCELDDPFYMKVNGRWFLRGLINTYFFRDSSNTCSDDNTSPVLYEDMKFYTNWIQETIGKFDQVENLL